MRQAIARAHAPASAWTMGVLSLIPFYLFAGLYCYGPQAMRSGAFVALIGWSAAMLSYLGGVRAGLEIDSHDKPRLWSVALAMLSPVAGFGLLFGGLTGSLGSVQQVSGFMTAFLLMWIWDQRMSDGPAWRPRYRTAITTGAAIALAFALEQALRM
ncbi:MAG: DUF3429 domain-containing protein [Caulobacter sp.]|nr:DUF3429 domain-containing protein [Caulobacter sp.]